MGKSKWDKSPAQLLADKRDKSPLKLTPRDAKMLNNIKTAATKADERARRGGSGVVLLPVSTLRRLEFLAGRSPEHLKVWDIQQEKYKMQYPVGSQLIYNELRYVRDRVQAYKEAQNG